MNPVFCEIRLVVNSEKEKEELFKFLKDFGGYVDLDSLLTLELNKKLRRGCKINE